MKKEETSSCTTIQLNEIIHAIYMVFFFEQLHNSKIITKCINIYICYDIAPTPLFDKTKPRHRVVKYNLKRYALILFDFFVSKDQRCWSLFLINM